MTRVVVITGDPSLPDTTKPSAQYSEEDLHAYDLMRTALQAIQGCEFSFWTRHQELPRLLRESPPDLVLNLCDTGFRNNAAQELHIPAYLELLGIPYTGAPPAAMVLCYDKQIVRLVAEALGIAVPQEALIEHDHPFDALPKIYPSLLKPNQADGSLGITSDAVVRTPEEAARYLAELHRLLPGRAVLMQEFLPGDEYSIGLIGNPDTGMTVLPALAVDYSGLPADLEPILSYESKTIPTSPYWSDIGYRAAEIPESRRRQMEKTASTLFRRLSCRDYARVDFRADAEGRIKLLEVNPNPAWAYDGKLALMAGLAGKSYQQMLEMILEAAQARLAASG